MHNVCTGRCPQARHVGHGASLLPLPVEFGLSGIRSCRSGAKVLLEDLKVAQVNVCVAVEILIIATGE
jgi:hypothetical protein